MNIPENLPTIVPVILAGGNGTRLWPLSRRLFPKQFLSLGGQHSLLQRTALALRALPTDVAPIVVASEQHRFLVREHLADIGIEDAPILLEPSARNTAPAIAAACAYVARHHGEDAIVLVTPADHVIDDLGAFVDTVSRACIEAVNGHLMTFGVAPSRAETGFGYIRGGVSLDTPGVLTVRSFVEKPSQSKAREYLESGEYLWNSGMFLFAVSAMHEVMQMLEPEIAEYSAKAVNGAEVDGQFVRLAAEPFMACRSESIDYAVMERTDRAAMAVMSADVGWDDVGCWSYLDRLPATDEQDNKTVGDVRVLGGRHNLVYADSRLVSLIGVDDLVVVETNDAILVTRRENAQEVKMLVASLREEQRPEVDQHPRVYRPWGYYETISLGQRFQCKRIVVKPGEKLSLQMHHHRSEHWIVVRGTAVVTIDGKDALLSENESTYIPLGVTHRLFNPGKVPLELIEVQSGAYLGEDDIVRFDDIYGRKPEAGKSDGRRAQAA